MCGITGYIGKDHSSIIEKMNNTIAHRGPDGEGFEHFENLSFGHRRLAIIDLSKSAHQPMHDPQKRYWITYNGEIYNYQIIKDELLKKGYCFKSNSDTEVVLNAFIEWGGKCQERFDGMWAFTIYDKQKRELFASRDPFGVKPFYYYQARQCFAFASEQKAILEIPGFKKEINEKAAFQYLALAKLELDEDGLFKNVKELKPGHCLNYNIDTKELSINQYFRLSLNTRFNNEKSLTFYSSAIKKELIEAIKTRLIADVDVASCLSGGIDSSTISGIIDYLGKKDHHCFSVIFPNKPFDESDWAKKVITKTNSIWHKVNPSANDFNKDLEKIVYAHDIPFLSCSTYAQYKVFESIHQNKIKVSIDGQGADELFSGYDNHFACYMVNSLKSGRWINYFKQFEKPHLLLNYTLKMQLSKLFRNYFQNRAFRNSQKEFGYINDRLWEKYKKDISAVSNAFSFNINKQLYKEYNGDILKNLLRTADRNGMTHSVEVRVPFADNKSLAQLCFRAPGIFKRSKTLLRQAAKEFLPHSIAQRKDKIAFASPEDEWLLKNKDQLKSYLPTEDDNLVKWSQINKDWDQLISKDHLEQRNARLWRLINFAIWKKVFEV